MDENTDLLNKKMSDLTVKDNILMAALVPIVTISAVAVTGLVVNGVKSLVNRRKQTGEITTTATTE